MGLNPLPSMLTLTFTVVQSFFASVEAKYVLGSCLAWDLLLFPFPQWPSADNYYSFVVGQGLCVFLLKI